MLDLISLTVCDNAKTVKETLQSPTVMISPALGTVELDVFEVQTQAYIHVQESICCHYNY